MQASRNFCLLTRNGPKFQQTPQRSHNSALPFLKDLQSSDQPFQAQQIIAVGRNINFIENDIRCTLGLFFTLFFTYNVLFRCLKSSKKCGFNLIYLNIDSSMLVIRQVSVRSLTL